MTLLVSLAVVIFSTANVEAADLNPAPALKTGEWDTEKSTDTEKWYKFDGTSYKVNVDSNYSKEVITVGSTKYYILDDVADFKTLNNASGKNFIVANDINLGAWTTAITVKTSVVEGCGHTVTFGSGSNKGLFSTFSGTVNNLKLEGEITNAGHVAALALWTEGGVFNGVTSSVNISFTMQPNAEQYYVGGLIANAKTGSVTTLNGYKNEFYDCANSGSITFSDDAHTKARAGGLVAANAAEGSSVLFVDCEYSGTLTYPTQADHATGGILGVSAGGDLTFVKCENKGTLNSKYITGGILGRSQRTNDVSYSLSFVDCVNSGTIKSGNDSAGGIYARNWHDNITVTVTGCTNAEGASVECTAKAGGIVGYNPKIGTMTVEDCTNYGSVSGASDNGGIIGVTENGTFTIKDCHNYADLSASSKSIGGIISTSKGTVAIETCTNEGDLSSSGGTVGGVVANPTGTVTIEGCTNKGDLGAANVGGITGNGGNTLTVSDCYNYGNITGTSNTGGISGYLGGGASCVIENCENGSLTVKNTVQSSATVGGIVGKSDKGLTVKGSVNYGDVTCTSTGTNQEHVAGGIIGLVRNDGAKFTFTDCVNNGNVTGKRGNARVAGILAAWKNYSELSFSGCVNNGTITVNNENTEWAYLGGILAAPTVENYDNDATNDGTVNITVDKCVNNGKLYIPAAKNCSGIGGIMAYTGNIASGTSGSGDSAKTYNNNMRLTITNCAFTGEIVEEHTYNNSRVGDIIGRTRFENANSSASIKNCFSTGTYSGKSTRHGFIDNDGKTNGLVTVENCYWGEGTTKAVGNNAGYITVNTSGAKTAVEFASGLVANALNRDGAVWYQNIDNLQDRDAIPTLDAKGGTVYEVDLVMGGQVLGKTYSNTNKATEPRFISTTSELRLDDTYETSGIRFLNMLYAYDFEVLKACGKNITLGTVITQQRFVPAEFTMAALDAHSSENYGGKTIYMNVVGFDTVDFNEGVYSSDSFTVTIAGSVFNMLEVNLDKAYAGVGYVKVGDDVTYSTSTVSDSSKSIAKLALDSGLEFTEAQIEILNKLAAVSAQ